VFLADISVHSPKALPMTGLALITGGAGFIGSHLADRLLAGGYRVRVLDSLIEQVHGESRARPSYLSPRVELCVGDVRDAGDVAKALAGVDCVFHLAALVGVGQSMYQAAEYVDVNVHGTALLLEQVAKQKVKRLVVASSMSIYGEGEYVDAAGQRGAVRERSIDRIRQGRWEVEDASGQALVPVPTREDKPAVLESVYALTKFDQERLCLIMGRAYGVPTVALRFFNVYGPRQALSNPYTGVLAIFASRLLNSRPPLLFEDGQQRRDFVSVYDVANACVLAMDRPDAAGRVFNVASGESRRVIDVANDIAKALGQNIQPEITGKYRVGDIRHCFADISLARDQLGYEPQVSFENGIRELAEYLKVSASKGTVARDRVLEARRELESRGLTL
jgi:dTDP-L-rhamnose 4-epimerase